MAPARPGALTVRTVSWVVGAAVLVPLLIWGWTTVNRPPAYRALLEHLRLPDGADVNYPRLGLTLRSRSWLLSGPNQPEGTALFVRLPDVEFGPLRIINERELRPSLALIVGSEWDARREGWVGAEGRFVSKAQVRDSLEAACPTPADARLVFDLLLGQPTAAASTVAARLMKGDLPVAVMIQPFSGTRGLLMRDVGRPPYKEAERRYEGCMLAFSGPGWPEEWRLARLSVVGY
ncbi:MAG TPA: hypothetical protein DCS97_06090 [Planctomycetes bacterium]|nr:hypothetical protein [Planctomycetota bacterium]